MGRARERTKRERRTARAFDDSWPPFEKLNISGATRAIRILPCAHTSRLPPAVEHGRTPCRVYGSRGRYFSVHEHDCLCRKGGRRRRRKEEEETLGGRAPTLGLNLARQNLVLCATCCIISVLTQWGATLVINLKGGGRRARRVWSAAAAPARAAAPPGHAPGSRSRVARLRNWSLPRSGPSLPRWAPASRLRLSAVRPRGPVAVRPYQNELPRLNKSRKQLSPTRT